MKAGTKKTLKRIMYVILAGTVFLVAIIVFANWKISHDSKDFIYSDANSIPAQKAALVLGAAKNIGGRQNYYFTYRMQAAKELYDAGKVKVFVVSGDNRWKDYNEADDMRNSLIELGVPDSIIHCDYAGLRTLDSVVRMNKIFGQDSFIVVSQEFHNERAIFIAQQEGLTVYGYNAKDLRLNRSSYRTKIREVLARVKVFVDIITDKQPRHLGEQIEI
ncbi:SanA protein [Dysgonomonas sp. PFB1-18]|uniref:SanA/YdcF family protein n=1 Tax=unclassified Dysgonomonas TaxID=2630389 RepID=UPI002477261D|nr:MULTISPECIES: ElyC/SanA/YdcF family protein [unclassified Dysgonomonas]MDH6310641.1 SanA protein [Dysgonomonas sp. PF1-14]MDH6340492.1 SanA protein [Dysgonomonas sp. PF1-16]MDH6382100.1 SanA protein [Dysgonomonas sp. PFB1-18]MDH6399444.1 SanA protein [Dysgonomonas sp. PF1-23]